MKKIISLLLLVVIISSCHKDAVTKTQNSDDVWIRIENTTGADLANAKVEGVDYGTVAPGSISEYKLITAPVYSPGCQFEVGGHANFAGNYFCAMPLLQRLEGGRYTFRIIEAQANILRYRVEVIK